jgi:hypothetical protein
MTTRVNNNLVVLSQLSIPRQRVSRYVGDFPVLSNRAKQSTPILAIRPDDKQLVLSVPPLYSPKRYNICRRDLLMLFKTLLRKPYPVAGSLATCRDDFSRGLATLVAS